MPNNQNAYGNALRGLLDAFRQALASGATTKSIIAALPHQQLAIKQLREAGFDMTGSDSSALEGFLNAFRQAASGGLSGNQIVMKLPHRELATKQLRYAGISVN